MSVYHCSQDELPFRGREFEKRYMSYVLQPPNDYPSHLPGIIEHQEHQYGKPCAPPELIGDLEKARDILQKSQKRSFLLKSPQDLEEKNK